MAKRERGEGTVIKWEESKQLFFQRFGYTDKLGRQKVKAIYGDSKGEVIEKARAWKKARDAGLDIDAGKMKYSEWLEHWLGPYKAGAAEETTAILYQRNIKKAYYSCLGGAQTKGHNPADTSRIYQRDGDEAGGQQSTDAAIYIV